MSNVMSIGESVDMMITSALDQVHTCMPAKVTAFDAAKQTVSCQLVLKYCWDDGSPPAQYPILADVPVVFPGAGDCWLVHDIPVDSYVLIIFAESSIMNWIQDGGVVDPEVVHRFDLSDAIAIAGLNPYPNSLTEIDTSAIALRSRDATAGIMLDADKNITVYNAHATVSLSSDGSVEMSNDAGTITINKTTGQVSVNGNLTIDA